MLWFSKQLEFTDAVDLDFEILTLDGKSLGTSAGATATEFIRQRFSRTRYINARQRFR
jgi:hypothetical protein